MQSRSERGEGISSFFCSILYGNKNHMKYRNTSTCDGLVVQMHSTWTYRLLWFSVIVVWVAWYVNAPIACTSHFNSDVQVKLEYLNVCLSYPYVEDDGSTRYILFYRSIGWSLLILVGFYCIPKLVSRRLDNATCNKLLKDLAANDKTEEQQLERAKSYLTDNLMTHNGLYWKFLVVNITALIVDVFAMNYLNGVLQGRFINYGSIGNLARDPEYFTDYTSETFPPFVSCKLSSSNQITNKRTERFGCHLTLMELYQELFLWVWAWLIMIIVVTSCYILFLLCMWLPCTKQCLLFIAKPVHGSENVRGVIRGVMENCGIGDIYLLYCIKGHMSHARFYELLIWLSHPSRKQPRHGLPNKLQMPDDETSPV